MAIRKVLFAVTLLGALACSIAADVHFKTWFPNNPTVEFHPGQVATAVIGVRNAGSYSFNLSACLGNLALVTDPAGNVYNFTGTGYQVPELASGEETVVEYFMPLPKNLPPRDFYLHLNIITSVGNDHYSAIAFNDTIKIIEEARLIDVELLGLYAIFIGTLASLGYQVYKFAISQGWLKKAKPAKKQQVASSDKSEWLKGTVADQSKKQK